MNDNPTLRTALNLLARREHGIVELTHKLTLKGFEPAMVDAAVQQCIKRGFLNETRFVLAYVRYRQDKGFGPLHIRHELRRRHVADNLIDEAVNIHDNTWLAIIEHLWQKRFKALKSRDQKMRLKQIHFLHTRGFTTEQINRVITQEEN